MLKIMSIWISNKSFQNANKSSATLQLNLSALISIYTYIVTQLFYITQYSATWLEHNILIL